MSRLFVGIGLPEPVAAHVALLGGGIPGARWEAADKLHLTLRFLGEQDGGTHRAVEEALRRIAMPPFAVTLSGVGHFPPRGAPRSLWVGLDDGTLVAALHQKVERALAPLGIGPDPRKFAPHVTIARLRGAPERKVAEFIAGNSLFRSVEFQVDHFALYSSVRSPSGSKYRTESVFRLDAAS